MEFTKSFLRAGIVLSVEVYEVDFNIIPHYGGENRGDSGGYILFLCPSHMSK